MHAWTRIAAWSFGGPAGQIAVIHRVAVVEKRWLDEESFARALGYCMLLPGPEAQQLATYIGWRTHGTAGALAAGGLFVLPGFVSILALSVAYAELGGTGVIESLFYGLKPAVLAIVLQALIRLQGRSGTAAWTAVVGGLAFLALFAFGVSFPVVIAGAGVAGVISIRSPGDVGNPEDALPAAAPDYARSARTALIWLLVWLIPVAALALLLPGDHVLVREAAFFSKAAVVTFGGAYAVLAYVAQQAVEVYGWLAPGEMLDGLGMAETTPGPLIQVVQFVGFMGAYRHAGGADPLLMGVVGSVITTWVTFAPCFLFVLAGAPLMEHLGRHPRLRGALRGITAGVLGAVLNLAAWFAVHALFGATRPWSAGPLHMTAPVWSTLDPGAAGIAVLAVVAAVWLRAGMFAVLGLGVAAGLGLRFLS